MTKIKADKLNRVSTDLLDVLQVIASEHFNEEVKALEEAYAQPETEPTASDYWGKLRKRDVALQAKWAHIKMLAQMEAGAVHSQNQNTDAEKLKQKDLMAKAEKAKNARKKDIERRMNDNK